MSWRTVVISKRCKLDFSMGYMVIRGEETNRIFIDEIAMLIIENPAVSMTGCLLSELTDKKIRNQAKLLRFIGADTASELLLKLMKATFFHLYLKIKSFLGSILLICIIRLMAGMEKLFCRKTIKFCR